jgi:hypothetical protein
MKRTPILLVLACVIAGMSMFSCDAMFQNNLFGGMTHKELTAGSLQDQSPSELKDTLDSDFNRQKIAEDPELKQAVLDQLEDSYDGTTGDTDSAEGQTAAILAADIIISTDPAASQLAAGALGALQTVLDLQDSEEPSEDDTQEIFTQIVRDILPLDIKNALGVEVAPPASFVGMIAAFSAANEVFGALNEGIGEDGAYLADVTDEEKVEIAFNALVAGVVGVVEVLDDLGDPIADPPLEDLAQALWSAISDPESATTFIGISDSAFDELTGADGIGNILKGLPFDFGSAE